MKERKNLNIGQDDFYNFITTNGYFVDKTLLVRDVIDSDHHILLIPRPRRFGKSLNMSMLRCFFDARLTNMAELFKPYKIWQAGEKYIQKQGKHPVIFLSLKKVRGRDFDECKLFLRQLLSNVYNQHYYLLEKNILNLKEKKEFEKILFKEADLAALAESLESLCGYLSRFYGQTVLILMDEYDSPIHYGYLHGYYDQIIDFMKSLMGSTFKSNPHLYKGVITGILRIAKESIFSDLNNPGIYTILDYRFSDKFGFTEAETRQILDDYNLSDRFEQVKTWYDGYIFGDTEHIYNPWSIMNYVSKHEQGFDTFWVNTSSDALIKNQITPREAEAIRQDIGTLLQGEAIAKTLYPNLVFKDLGIDRDLIWSLLVFSGYINAVKSADKRQYLLSIPNYELKTLFEEIVLEWLSRAVKIRKQLLEDTANYLVTNQVSQFKEGFKKIMGDTFSYFDTDTEPERVYHSYVLGLLAILSDDYIIKSNRESGQGRYDILLLPRDPSQYGVIIEIKTLGKNAKKETIKSKLTEALGQITKNRYYRELEAHNVGNRIEMAMVFAGKAVHIEVNNG